MNTSYFFQKRFIKREVTIRSERVELKGHSVELSEYSLRFTTPMPVEEGTNWTLSCMLTKSIYVKLPVEITLYREVFEGREYFVEARISNLEGNAFNLYRDWLAGVFQETAA